MYAILIDVDESDQLQGGSEGQPYQAGGVTSMLLCTLMNKHGQHTCCGKQAINAK